MPSLRAALFHLFRTSLLVTTASAFSVPDPIVHFGIGAIAGGCGAVAYQPFDYIKAQIQSDRGGELYQNNGLNCLVKTIQSDPRDLFKGMTAAVTGVAPEKSVKLGVNDVLRDVFTGYYAGVFPLWSQVLSGAVAGACQVIVSSPLDVIKIRMQTRESERKEEGTDFDERPSFAQLLEEVGGPKGLYRGVEACLIRDISFTAVCFPLYSYLLNNGFDAFSAGALSGIVSTFIATPSDMVKTRILTSAHASYDQTIPILQPEMQLQAQSNGAAVLLPMGGGNSTIGSSFGIATEDEASLVDWASEKPPATDGDSNAFQVAKKIVDQEGLAVLFTGVYERCGGAIPRFGITLGAHEWLEHYASSVGLLSQSMS